MTQQELMDTNDIGGMSEHLTAAERRANLECAIAQGGYSDPQAAREELERDLARESCHSDHH